MLALETAMRRGELLALDWDNIRLQDRVAYLPLTKNGSSRSVPLSSTAVAVLEGLTSNAARPRFPHHRQRVGIRVCTRSNASEAHICRGRRDRRPTFVDLHFHDLRHIAISRLAEKLPNVIELAAVSGHRDVRMLNRYYHVRAEDLAEKLG